MEQENIQKRRGRPFGSKNKKNKPKQCTTITEAELELSPRELVDATEAVFYEKQIKDIDLLIEEQEKIIKQAREMRNEYVAMLTKLLNTSVKRDSTSPPKLKEAGQGELEV